MSLEPEPEQRADAVADLHRGDLLGRKCGQHRRVDRLDLGVDHVDLGLGESEPGLRGIDAELRGGGVDRLAVQPSNTAFSPTGKGEA